MENENEEASGKGLASRGLCEHVAHKIAFASASARRTVRLVSDACKKTPSPEEKHSSKAPGSPAAKHGQGFWTVTGNDFGRSIKWARKQPNALSEHIKTARSSSLPETK